MTDVTVEQVPIDRLHPDPANARRISEAELEALTRSITEFGFVAAGRGPPGRRGHRRPPAPRRGSQRLGMETVPVIWLDVDVEQGRLLGLALNRISGEWDEQLLARLLGDLQESVDISLSGFGEDELKDLLRSLEAREKRERPESFDLDEALEATKKPRTKPGDVWALGEHRLLCGDATKPEDVARVLDDRQADLCFTDPPYNVAMGDHGGQGRGKRKRRIANDAMDPVAWEAFVRGCDPDTCWPRSTAPSTSACPARSCRSSRASFWRKVATGPTRIIWAQGPLRASAAPTTSAPTSRSGMAGAKARSTSGTVVVTRTTSGASTAPSSRRCTRR